MCKFGKTHNIHMETMEKLKCSSSDFLEIRVFMVTVSPPASFTCVHEFNFRKLRSQTYKYSGSVIDHHKEGVSSFYICFSSFVVVGLFIMTAAVIMTNIRSKTKDTNSTAVTNNDYHVDVLCFTLPSAQNHSVPADRAQSACNSDVQDRHSKWLVFQSVCGQQRKDLEKKNPCYHIQKCVFTVTVSPPSSFTCVKNTALSEPVQRDLHFWLVRGSLFRDVSDAWYMDNHTMTDFPDSRFTTTTATTATPMPVPNITVYRQMEDGEHVIVMCENNMAFRKSTLSVESEQSYMLRGHICRPYTKQCVFLVTVSPPASFTCVHEIHSDEDIKYLRSQTYNYRWSVMDHHKEGVSLFYICFSSSIAVGLFIMTAAVIMTNIRSRTKVYQQIEDREHVIVMCSFGKRFIESSFQLSVDREQNYTLKNPVCIAYEVCVFNITVRPPVSLTCIHEIITFRNESYLQSEAYVLDHYDGVSSSYIGFFSFIVVGVVIMTAAVIMTTIRSNAKDSNGDYVDV
ncbi:hypothetical protein H4Q32_007792 [Labeo rohita]|uniref:Uncharacterized protein n=1 Tax=Labeo rohita TaxID=84645 RepID=A0ABQ8MHD1_LABRO|nr:hypothetical protein H4Q32_007792 [Labeo rohita]